MYGIVLSCARGSLSARESYGLLLGELNILRLVLAVSGLLATVGLMGDLLRQRRRIKALIAQLQEE